MLDNRVYQQPCARCRWNEAPSDWQLVVDQTIDW